MLIGIHVSEQGNPQMVLTAECLEEYNHLYQMSLEAQRDVDGVPVCDINQKLRQLTVGIHVIRPGYYGRRRPRWIV